MPPALDSAWSPPASFDGFALRGLIGEGGMGRVYLAHEEMLDRSVAIKFILAEEIEGAARERFLTEARAVARLSHANIVAVHRIGEVQGRPYVAYEYIDGASAPSLRSLFPEDLSQQRAKLAAALQLIVQICAVRSTS
jgi:eukaryotic-like serine/threonine-protein kinase